MVKYSIITPCYNSYHLMGKYFDSLENQTYKNFEIIIIDDCSNDDSLNCLYKYKKYSNLTITVINNPKNLGPGESRNIGLDHSSGDYILFIDSDDYVEKNMFQTLEKYVNDDSFVVFDYFINEDKSKQSIMNEQYGIVETKDVLLEINTSVWGKVFRKKIIDDNLIRFPDLMRFEDFSFLQEYILKTNEIHYVNEKLYHYVENKKSIVHSYSNASEFSFKAFMNIYDDYHWCKEIAEAVYVREIIYVSIKEYFKTKRIREAICIVNKYESFFPNWKKNANVKKFNLGHRIVLFLFKNKLYFLLKCLLAITG